jgi:hypothetical protein
LEKSECLHFDGRALLLGLFGPKDEGVTIFRNIGRYLQATERNFDCLALKIMALRFFETSVNVYG